MKLKSSKLQNNFAIYFQNQESDFSFPCKKKEEGDFCSMFSSFLSFLNLAKNLFFNSFRPGRAKMHFELLVPV